LVEIQTLNAINILILHKPNLVKLKVSKRKLSLLQKFLELNIIKCLVIKNKQIIIKGNKNYNTKLSIIYSNTKKIPISLKTIKRLKNNYILKTSRGILTSTEAVKFKVGGLLLAKL